jgi:hypothetical protein
MDLVGLIVVLLVALLVYWMVHRLAVVVGMAPQVLVIFDVLLVGALALWLLDEVGWLSRVRR